MATLYVAEFVTVGGGANFPVPGGFCPPSNEQVLAIGGASTPGAAFAATTHFVRVHADSVCSIAFGLSPVATTNNMRVAANQTEYFAVVPGQTIAVIINT